MMCIYDSCAFLLKYTILSMYSYKKCSVKITARCLSIPTVLSYSMHSSRKFLDHLRCSMDKWICISLLDDNNLLCFRLDFSTLLAISRGNLMCYVNPTLRILRYCSLVLALLFLLFLFICLLKTEKVFWSRPRYYYYFDFWLVI